jgi:hypothetical protein
MLVPRAGKVTTAASFRLGVTRAEGVFGNLTLSGTCSHLWILLWQREPAHSALAWMRGGGSRERPPTPELSAPLGKAHAGACGPSLNLAQRAPRQPPRARTEYYANHLEGAEFVGQISL